MHPPLKWVRPYQQQKGTISILVLNEISTFFPHFHIFSLFTIQHLHWNRVVYPSLTIHERIHITIRMSPVLAARVSYVKNVLYLVISFQCWLEYLWWVIVNLGPPTLRLKPFIKGETHWTMNKSNELIDNIKNLKILWTTMYCLHHRTSLWYFHKGTPLREIKA